MISIGLIRSCSDRAHIIHPVKIMQINNLRHCIGAFVGEKQVRISERRQKVAAETPQGG